MGVVFPGRCLKLGAIGACVISPRALGHSYRPSGHRGRFESSVAEKIALPLFPLLADGDRQQGPVDRLAERSRLDHREAVVLFVEGEGQHQRGDRGFLHQRVRLDSECDGLTSGGSTAQWLSL